MQRPQQADKQQEGTPELTGKRITCPARHHRRTAPSCQPDRTDEGMDGWREWDGRPKPHHHQKAQSDGERAPVPLCEFNSN